MQLIKNQHLRYFILQLGLKTRGKPVEIPTKSRGFAKKNWIDISGGEHHTLALDDEGATQY